MRKDAYLKSVTSFSNWFANVIDAKTAINFRHGPNSSDKYLKDALVRYQWPHKRISFNTPNGAISISARSDFQQNAEILSDLEKGIRSCLKKNPINDEELSLWAEAIMKWGGVFTRRGNAAWLKSKDGTFSSYLQAALQSLSAVDGTAHLKSKELRSNAGTTKIHSLALPNFVIYDSRVAAALAWLVIIWSQQEEGEEIPEQLRFACMQANTNNAHNPKIRSPNPAQFKYFSASGAPHWHHHHATWNLRANWVICEALSRSENKNNWTPRHIEAALFVMGANLAYALEN